jgi:3-dehydroquinate synthase
MVDASVGGKNGVDLGNLKNQIGVFNRMVIVDTHILSRFKNEMRSGLAEMLANGLIYDKAYWEQLDFKSDFADLMN